MGRKHRGTGKPPGFGQQHVSADLLPWGDGEGPGKDLGSYSPAVPKLISEEMSSDSALLPLTWPPFSPSHSSNSSLPSLGVRAGGSSPMADANCSFQEGKDPSLQDSKTVSSSLLCLISKQITVCLDNCQITPVPKTSAEPQVGLLHHHTLRYPQGKGHQTARGFRNILWKPWSQVTEESSKV